MKQLTKEQAIKFAEEKLYKQMTVEQRGIFQLQQDLLCMPFSKFREGVEKALGRSVWTHEFANAEGLIAELEGKAPAPTFDEITAKLPQDKLLFVMKD